MASRKNVQDAHISSQLDALHRSTLAIVAAMNGAQRDELLLREAGIQLDRALFPLLVGIERFGPIGVVDLADRAGRDYTTVSRQVAKLEELGLIKRQPNKADRRIREAIIAPKGRAMTKLIDAARERLVRAAFANWATKDLDSLVHLLSRYAEALQQ